MQQALADFVVVIVYGLPDGSQPGFCFQIRVGSFDEKPGNEGFAALPHGYLQRGEPVVQGIGVCSILQHGGGGALDADTPDLVAVLVLPHEQTQRGFIVPGGCVRVCPVLQRLVYLVFVDSGYAIHEFPVQLLYAATAWQKQAEQQKAEQVTKHTLLC